MPVAAGRRDRLITIERATTVEDDYGGEQTSWSELAREWAEVRFGSASERREAAQETATATATFGVLDNSRTRSVRETDRILFDGATWDITGVAPSIRAGEGLEFTATRRGG